MEEFEEVLEDLRENDNSFTCLELSFDVVNRAPFSFDLYQQRLGRESVSDEQFCTFLDLLAEAISANETVEEVRVDWRFLRILKKEEKRSIFHSLAELSNLSSIELCIVDDDDCYFDPQSNRIPLSMVSSLLKTTPNLSVLSISNDGYVSASKADIEVFSLALVRHRTSLRHLSLKNLLLVANESSTLETGCFDFLGSSLSCLAYLELLELSLELPRQRQVPVSVVSRSCWRQCLSSLLPRLSSLQLDNFGLDKSFIGLLTALIDGKPSSLTRLSLQSNRLLKGEECSTAFVKMARLSSALKDMNVPMTCPRDHAVAAVQLWLNECRPERHTNDQTMALYFERLNRRGARGVRTHHDIGLTATFHLVQSNLHLFCKPSCPP